MANDLATQGGRALDAGANPWAEAARGVETGTYLKFNGNDGRWSFGQDDDDLPEGSRVVMDMQTLAFGWICWVEGSVEEEKLVMVVDGRPPREEDLTDYGPYEEDDGWREAASISMILESYGDDDQDEAVGTPLLWKTSTGGQVRQIRKLSGAYGRVFSQHPGEYPIVELGEESYEPRNKRYGKRKFSPVMKIVGWMTAAELEGLTGEPVDDDEPEEPAPKGRGRKAKDEPEAEEKPARGRGRKAKDPEPEPEEDEDFDDEPEEEEEKPARGRRRRAEPEEDEEETAPPPRGRTRGRKAAKEEEPEEDDDGDEEEAAPPRRGRARGGNRRLRNFD
ncbi:hypothetical protein [Erythrobacter phage vB_EliS-L02]|nr:hypothetical protein [Erythrobacter phage vB_EliS-L02]